MLLSISLLPVSVLINVTDYELVKLQIDDAMVIPLPNP